MKILYHVGSAPSVRILPKATPGRITTQVVGPRHATTRAPYRWPRHNPNVPDIIPQPAPRMTSWPDAPFILQPWEADNPPPPPIPLDIRGKIGQTVYQKTYRILPNGTQSTTPELQRRRMVVPADPRTETQLRTRARFGRAVQLWNSLTPQERQTYNTRGRARQPWLEGLNVWIREYSGAHDLDEFADLAAILRTTGRLPPLD